MRGKTGLFPPFPINSHIFHNPASIGLVWQRTGQNSFNVRFSLLLDEEQVSVGSLPISTATKC